MYNRIIDVKALNSEGEMLIEDSYKNSRLDEGVEKIIDSAVAQGSLKMMKKIPSCLPLQARIPEKFLK